LLFLQKLWSGHIILNRNLRYESRADPFIAHQDAMICGNARKKYWHMSKIKWVAIAMPERYFIDNGLYLPGN
jgi:hypothetical protein